MSTTLMIILILVILLLVYLLYTYWTGVPGITGVQNAQQTTIINPNKLPSGANASNFTYSIWFYISDWNYKYGEEKVLISRPINADKKEFSPQVTLGPIENNLDIQVQCYAEGAKETPKAATIPHTCNVMNIPIQKWVNLLVSVYGRSMDVYLDGKLVRTCVLPGSVKVNTTSVLPIYVTPNGGFSGFTSRFMYIDQPTNPEQAYAIYKDGFERSGSIGNIFNEYRVKVSFLENNKEQGSFEI